MAASVQSMTEFWKTFDLQELQKSLDSTATELANRQDESDISRKRLIEQSRDFKKNTPEDIRKVVSPLLKSFQGEIDALSKRSKAAEAAFLSVYKKLIDLPDPVPVLEYALQVQKRAQRVQDLEIENKQLRETLAEYNHEFAEVKNQEVTIKQLRERLKEGEEKVEAVAEARAKEKERELQRQFVEKERQLQDTQLEVAKKLGEAEQRVASLNYQLENAQSELFEVKAKYDEATSAKSDEMEMVMADMERANERATAAEREVEKLKHQLSSLTASLSDRGQMQKGPDMEQAIDILQRSSLEVELAAKEKEISQLVEDVQRLQASLKKLQETTTQQVSKLEEELSSKNKAFRILEEKLQSQEDYEEIKRELSVLKSIEFSPGSPTDEVDGGPDKTKSLEMLLLEKNKALQSENTQLKVNSSDLSETSSPTLSSNAEAFVSLLGEELVATYRAQQSVSGKSSPDSPPKNGIASSSFSSVSPPTQEDKKSPSPEVGGDIPPQTLSSPRSDINKLVRTPSVEHQQQQHHLPFPPPQSPQMFHPGFPGPLMTNFMGLNIPIKTEVNGMQGLDTGMVSKTVRELLSIHNIGQRLFAKHVLGLSQGTVSELLSKPKSWDKLTEKGRESYRKMHSWATDERNILALKAISPKKGSQPLLPSVQQEDSQTEKRIAHILQEAQHAMQHKKVMEQVWNKEQQNAMVSSIYHEMARYRQMQESRALSSATSPTINPPHLSNHNIHEGNRRRSEREKQVDSDISAKDMVERIYRQELIKLAQAAENAGNIAASTLYQQELARLAQNARMKDDREPGELRRSHTSPNGVNVKTEPPDSTSDDLLSQSNGPIDLSTTKHSASAPSTPSSAGSDKSLNNSAHHAGSAFFLVRPKVNGHDGPDNHHSQQRQQQQHPPTPTQTTAEGVSPLQRMQHIANSLMTHPHIGPPCNKPLKAVLPPITQEEFDQYSNVNTEELVKQVKETLSQYSISQRLFGESILGLSQGSVSDLLARPKPWHMLTQKGREPFIRMQLFLEDAEAIPKLVASQYHIAPDKLMRSNSMGKEQKMENMGPWPGPLPGSIPVAALPLVSPVVQGSLKVPQSEKVPRPPNVPLMLPSLPTVPPMEPHYPLLTHHHQQAHWASFSYPSSMLEVVAMTSEIDTLELTSRVKDVLQFNNLGQKLFGEAVLGLSQGSVSELLSKPKPWHMLSIKGREPFIKMHLWLSDPHNVERLKHFQNEIKASRRRRHSIEDRYDSPVSLPKRPRVFFSEEQKERLRQAYNRDPYPNQSTIEALAASLGVGVKTVINWFHNHRMRAKQQQHANSPNTPYNEFSESVESKGDPNDENSNHSDISSLSGENRETSTMPNFPAGYQSNDSSQWLFPQFEPIHHRMKRSQEMSDQNHSDDDLDGNMSSPHSAKDNPDDTKESESDDDDNNNRNDDDSDTIGDIGVDDNSNLDSSTEKVEKDVDLSEEKKQSVQHGGANKRKRSHPKYVSAGRHLDKTVDAFENVSFGTEANNDDRETEKENEGINEDNNITNDIVDHLEKIAKFKKSLENSDEFSFDGSSDRNFSIDKITKNINQNSNEDWEF